MQKYLVTINDWCKIEKYIVEAETRSKASYMVFKLSKVTSKFEHFIKYVLKNVEKITE